MFLESNKSLLYYCTSLICRYYREPLKVAAAIIPPLKGWAFAQQVVRDRHPPAAGGSERPAEQGNSRERKNQSPVIQDKPITIINATKMPANNCISDYFLIFV